MRWFQPPTLGPLLLTLVGLATACDAPPWAMPCPEGWVMREDQTCYDPSADDDDSARSGAPGSGTSEPGTWEDDDGD